MDVKIESIDKNCPAPVNVLLQIITSGLSNVGSGPGVGLLPDEE